ncbi:dihydroxyacetone kinase subunit DhaK [Vagococcus fluvialis]|jgi:dihydroxyacetone kinase/dihydroxyacetone kinase-like protein|uniref:dihydroxyacetone kinase subunit DhaK n=1 Tax=Vagococcus fluvialis TaxID=2738 RepID=UPI001D0A3B7F|nr:dihydroxyacetone kinase subunit DhaK [Vagococcus fluvialis]MDR2279175.1 DhaKLM operon coactivator DhaQ [Vagococcus sp.]UDM71709.1 DhaKLM operon coactivator DhaQ [Vagococcus fluvialis]UDM76572.1 DhaKLM operon coactivator DhaQ [Vagococcus fluvialis]UDM83401.1 DhaKLM operon coactivator DhaQ [Vagococcus fluvialis]
MTQIINKPKDTVSQVLNGVAFIHQDKLERVKNTGIIKYKNIKKNQVAVISGGGSGHEPAHFGYVGSGMLSASVSGPIFIPPKATEILKAIKEVNSEMGTLLIIKNFEADVTAFLEAEKLAKEAGLLVEHVIVNDDCSIEEGSYKKRRRGVAGTIFVEKILGAAAQSGMTLGELKMLGEEVILATNTLGVALASGKEVGSEAEIFHLEKGQISFGIGIHGEAGYREETFFSSEYLANELINKLLAQYRDFPVEKIGLMINGLGTTTVMEQYIFANDVKRLLQLEGIEVVFQKSGDFMTSTNMAGISLTFLALKEDKWLDYLKEETDAFAW